MPDAQPQALTEQSFLQIVEQVFTLGRFEAVVKASTPRPFPEPPVYTRGWWHMWPRKPVEIGEGDA